MPPPKLTLRLARQRAEIEATGALAVVIAGLLVALVVGLALVRLMPGG